MRPTPKRQHYVPQFLLKKFLDPHLVSNGKEMLWVYEANREPKRAYPKTTAFVKDFYTYELGDTKFYDVDDAFTGVEGLVAPIIEKLANRSFKLSVEEKVAVAGFVALSFIRTPFFRECIDGDNEAIMNKIDQIASAQPGFIERLSPTLKNTQNAGKKTPQSRKFNDSDRALDQFKKALSLMSSLQIWDSLTRDIAKMSNVYYVTEGEHRFLTTDISVSLYDPVAPLGAGFRSSITTQYFFPISKNICLTGNWLGKEGFVNLKPTTVRKVNKYAMGFAKRFVFASEQSNTLRDLFTRLWNERNKPSREKDA